MCTTAHAAGRIRLDRVDHQGIWRDEVATRACIIGAYLNIRVNASGPKDRAFAEKIITEGREIEEKTAALEHEIIGISSSKLLKINS